jgi:glycosyltransferase involved in cell wall biosynthesis
LKKVIFFTSSHKIGLTSVLAEQACSIHKYAKERFLFISGEKEQFPGLFDKLDYHHINYAKIIGLDDHENILKLVNNFKNHADKFKPDVVHVHTNWQLIIVVIVKYICRKKYSVVYELHGYRHNYRIRSIIARCLIGVALYLFADKVISTSSFLKRKFSFLGKKNEIIFHGVDEEFWGEYNPLKHSDEKRIIFPGEFRKGKNQELLICVLREYIDQSGDKAIELYLPGKGQRLETCKRLCKELKLEKKVFFPGLLNRDQMLQYYLMCQFAVIPTNYETFGQCISEPYVLGRVVISRRVGIAEDIITHGINGFLFNTKEELLELLVKILLDKDKCAFVSKNAFEGRDIFRWDDITQKYLVFVENIDRN